MLSFGETKRIKNRSEEIRMSGVHPYTPKPSQEDMMLLEKVKVQSFTFPVYFTLALVPTVLIGSLRF